ncbi:hypothetical protein D3C78_773880 [compost metagenome]
MKQSKVSFIRYMLDIRGLRSESNDTAAESEAKEITLQCRLKLDVRRDGCRDDFFCCSGFSQGLESGTGADRYIDKY